MRGQGGLCRGVVRRPVPEPVKCKIILISIVFSMTLSICRVPWATFPEILGVVEEWGSPIDMEENWVMENWGKGGSGKGRGFVRVDFCQRHLNEIQYSQPCSVHPFAKSI